MSKLTQERVKELFDYDSESGILYRKFKSGNRKPCGHKPKSSHGYGAVKMGEKMYLTHRVIWLWQYGSMPNGEIDHIDQNKMNNRIENLRVVSASENMHNRGLRRDNSSGYPGVYWSKRHKKYKAQIRINNKKIYLGYYNTAEEAFEAYKRAKMELHPTSPIAQQYLRELTMAG